MLPELLLSRSRKRLQGIIFVLQKRDSIYSYMRLGIVISGLSLLVLALYLKSEQVSGISVFFLLILFNLASFLHKGLRNKIRIVKLRMEIKEDHLNRLHLKWDNIPDSVIKPEKQHPFAQDLDIFGDCSLMRLLDTTTSRQAQTILAEWLTEKESAPKNTLHRQGLVKELLDLSNFRDKFRLTAGFVSADRFDGDKLINWLKKSLQNRTPFFLLPVLIFLALNTAALFTFSRLGYIDSWWWLSFIIYVSLFLIFGRFIGRLFSDGIELSDELRKIQRLVQHIDGFHFRSGSGLENLCRPLKQRSSSASKHIKAVHRLVIIMGLRENPIIRLIVNAVLPVDFMLNYLLDRQKKRMLAELPQWLDVLYNFDALSSLSGFAALHSEYSFPQFAADKNSEQALFQAGNMAHPLIAAETKIANSFNLQRIGGMAMITGSNMSGKSTFLRTVGINLALAYAGTAVNAEVFKAGFFRINTCIHIDDSLSDGISYFYAEVKRLKSILSALEEKEKAPVFYLIDEIYKGTNNRERLIGSRAYILALADKNGLGIVTTHDLELTQLEEEIECLTNFHFTEHIQDGKMKFDYLLKSGPCPSTNALKIMEMEGLPAGEKPSLVF